MDSAFDRVEEDQSAGLKIDAFGRRYFKQRHVRFLTLTMDENEIHTRPNRQDAGSVEPLQWSRLPSHQQILSFANQSSKRYLYTWYRIIEVMTARGMSDKERKIFRLPFFKGNSFLDIGVPENTKWSSMELPLHHAVLNEYKNSLTYKSNHRTYYLSEYLENINRDLIKILSPYEILWSVVAKQMNLKRDIEERISTTIAPLYEICFFDKVRAKLVAMLREKISHSVLRHEEHRFANEHFRSMIRKFKATGDIGMVDDLLLGDAVKNFRDLKLPDAYGKLGELYFFPKHLYKNIRSLLGARFHLHRIDMQSVKANRIKKISSIKADDPLLYERRERALSLFDIYKKELMLMIRNHQILTSTETIFSFADVLRDTLLSFINELEETYITIENFYRQSYELNSDSQLANVYAELPDQKMLYAPYDRLKLEDPVAIGDPLEELHLIHHAKELLKKRLRVVRKSSAHYSLIPGQLHGVIPLNPVMKLWKHKPSHRDKDFPDHLHQELNTRPNFSMLLDLALVADDSLQSRKLIQSKRQNEERGDESFNSMLKLLIPGSCFPLRELDRDNFPEFRGHVIGESRTPSELGVPMDEKSILTGAWYSRYNHTLYYTVGADSASLLYIIFRSGRANSLPALFFAIGQFVHDTFPDEVIYRKSGPLTFREVVEDYYEDEERSRKNRGEKTGRKRNDNSRTGIRFMFSVIYARMMLESLTLSPQTQFRFPPVERWMSEHTSIQPLYRSSSHQLKVVRDAALSLITKDRR